MLRKYPIVPFVGRGRALKRPVHVDDLVRGFLAICGNPKTYGKTYALSGGEAIELRELAHLILCHYDLHKPIVSIPVWLCKILAAVFERTTKHPPLTWNAIAGLTQDADLDHSLATTDLDYRPIGIREGLSILPK